MRVKFRDVECYRDYQYDYTDDEKTAENTEFIVWNPLSLNDTKKEEKKPKPAKENSAEVDYTDILAEVLGLRSLRNQSEVSDVEQLDPSDIIDVPVVDHLNETKLNRQTYVPDTQNETSSGTEAGGVNLTQVISRSQSFSGNTTHTHNSSAVLNRTNDDGGTLTVGHLLNHAISENTTHMYSSDAFNSNDSSMYKTENKTFILNEAVVDRQNLTLVNSFNHSCSGNTKHTHNNSTESNFNNYFTNKTESKTIFSNWTEVDGGNLSVVNLDKQGIRHGPTHKHNSSAKSNFNNYLWNKTENKTLILNPTEVNLTLVNSLNQSFSENITHRHNNSAESNSKTFILNQTEVDTRNQTLVNLFKQNFSENAAHTHNSSAVLNRIKVDGGNLTVGHLMNHTISENTTHTQGSAESILNNSSAYKTDRSFLYSIEADEGNITRVQLLNQSMIENMTHIHHFSAKSSAHKLENTAVLLENDNRAASGTSDTKNTTAHNATAAPQVQNVSTETINPIIENEENVTVASHSDIVEGGRTNVTLSSDTQTALTTTVVDDNEDRLTRGDVFSYSVPKDQYSTPEGNVSVTSPPPREDENNTATTYVNVSADATNSSIAIPDFGEVNISSCNLTTFVLETTDNNTSDNDSARLQMDSSEVVTNPPKSVPENITHVVQNITAETSRSNSSAEISLQFVKNVTEVIGDFNYTSSTEGFPNETGLSGNVSLDSSVVKNASSEEVDVSDISDEVIIYLKENSKEGIKSTSVKTQGHNWTYEGTHHIVPLEIPDNMIKYFENETPQKAPPPKKIKTVTLRQKPEKGQGMKTKKKKEYKPQARSGLPFSPRGFNPSMTPRGARPSGLKLVSDEEELSNTPVVIGMPRPDFSVYELYVPGDEQALLYADEYEYVSYKDPYRGRDDIKNFNLDETTKYFLKFLDSNVKTYFIAAEEVEWDYSGYGQR